VPAKKKLSSYANAPPSIRKKKGGKRKKKEKKQGKKKTLSGCAQADLAIEKGRRKAHPTRK